MQQILALNPSQLDISGILAQFDGITSLSFPALDGLPMADGLAAPDLGGLADFGATFSEMAGRLGQGPQALAAGLTGALSGLGDGALEANDLLGSMQETFGNLTALTDGSFLAEIDRTIGPLAQLLQGEGDGAAGLIELFPLDSLGGDLPQQLTQLVDAGLEQVQAIDLADVANLDWLAGYQAALAAVSTLEPGQELEAEAVAALATIGTEVEAKTTLLESRLAQLDAFRTEHLARLQGLPETLDTVLARLDPQALGGAVDVINQAIDRLAGPEFEALLSKIDGVVQAVDAQALAALQQVTATISQVFDTINQGLDVAKQALVQVSAVITDLLNQLKGFIQTAKATLAGLLETAKQTLATFTDTVNGFLDQINGVIGQVFTFAREIVAKIASLDFTPFIEALHNMLYQITAILDHPEVRRVLDTVKEIVGQIAQQLDSVTLEPVFDQVIAQSDQVKATLAAIDTSQMNAMLRAALKQALDLLLGVIDPPTKVTDLVKEQYDANVKPVTTEIIQAAQEQFNQVIEAIDQFEPGTLVANLLTPHYELLVETVQSLIDPAQVLDQLAPLSAFYDNLLATVDEAVNPDRLLGVVTGAYDQMLAFVDGLSAEQLLVPLEDLLNQAKAKLDLSVLEGLINQVIEPVKTVQAFVATLDDRPEWQTIESILETPLATLVDGLVQRLRGQIDRIANFPALTPVREALLAVKAFIDSRVVPKRLEQIEATVLAVGAALRQQLASLADQWQAAQANLERLSLPALADLQAGFQALNPVRLLAAPANLIRQMEETVQAVLATATALWQRLADLFGQVSADLLALANGDIKPFLHKILDSFVAGPLQKITVALEKPMAVLNRVKAALLHLQQAAAGILQDVVTGLEGVRDGVLGTIQDALDRFNLDFLREALAEVEDLIKTPLAEIGAILDGFLDEVRAIYRRVMATLQSINPIGLIASARGTLRLAREETAGSLLVPVGTELAALTPGGERRFRTIQPVTLAEGQDSAPVLVQAVAAGRSGEIVVGPEGADQVEWQPLQLGEQTLTASHPEPILSLYTLAFDVVMKKLALLHPEKLIAEPLNAQFEKIRQLLDELGLESLFNILFEKFDRLEQEVFQGLDRSAGALRGVISAVPL